MTRSLLLLLAALGCVEARPPAGDDAPDADADADADSDTEPVALHGTVPSKALAAPTFTATNRDGTTRDRAALLGHPTVMWFYPQAATSG
jgi:cytochrome oxidase Cu insertion factor (SCO1/SenC/PrrC family)